MSNRFRAELFPTRGLQQSSASSPVVSVVINNHNYGQFLGRAIDSVLAQQFVSLSASDVEIIVVDDGSTDHSRALIESYGSRIVSIFKQNGGQDSAFNVGFKHSQGEIVCFLDADDRFTPNKLEKIVTCFTQYSDIGWCFHSLLLQDTYTEKPICSTQAFPGGGPNRSQYCDFREQLRLGSLPFYPVATSGLCFRRSVLQQILPMPETFIKTSADRYVRLAAVGLAPGYYLAEALTVQGIHGGNASTMRRDRPAIPERQIVIAYLLRTQFPELARYANRLFSRGLTAYQSISPQTVEAGYKPFIQQYWQLCSPVEWLTIVLIRLYRQRPWRRQIMNQTADFYNFSLSQKQTAVLKVKNAPAAR